MQTEYVVPASGLRPSAHPSVRPCHALLRTAALEITSPPSGQTPDSHRTGGVNPLSFFCSKCTNAGFSLCDLSVSGFTVRVSNAFSMLPGSVLGLEPFARAWDSQLQQTSNGFRLPLIWVRGTWFSAWVAKLFGLKIVNSSQRVAVGCNNN